MKKILLFLLVVLSGCSTVRNIPEPTPSPPPEKCVWIPGKGCKKIAASDSGTTVRGYRDNTQTEEEPK